MFAMLRGPWPRVTSVGTDLGMLEAAVADGAVGPDDLERALARLVDETLAAQIDAGCEVVTDGQVRWADPASAVVDAVTGADLGASGMLVRAFRDTASRLAAGSVVAQAVPGPFTLAAAEAGDPGDPVAASARAIRLAEMLAGELAALRDAGCAMVIVEEPAAAAVRSDEARAAWVTAHGRLLRDVGDMHVMLSITGGDATGIGGRAIGGLPYASVLVDLLAGPDNWYVVRDLPGDRGVVCAALAATAGKPLGDQLPQLVWAAQYAASKGGRGLERVGFANASSLASLPPAEARAALDALVAAARFSVMPPDKALAAGFDERAWRTMPRPPSRAG